MRILIILLFISFISLGQNIQIEEYFEDGKKIIEKTWQDGEQVLTLVEIVHNRDVKGTRVNPQYSEYRYYINQNGVEVGLTAYLVKEYGKYMKLDVSIINATKQRFDFIPNEIYYQANGIKNKEKYYIIPFEEYSKKVIRKQKSQAFWTAFAQGMDNASAGNVYSQSDSYIYDSYGYRGYVYTNTTSYSPALQQMRQRQNAEDMARLQDNQQRDMNFINEGYLKNHTIFPNSQLEGYLLTKPNKKITDFDLTIKLGNMEFDYSNDRWGPLFE